MSESRYRLSIEQIKNYLPHRAPFLLIDRVLEIHPVGDINDATSGPHKVGVRVKALKNITYNEPFFQGHFPQFSIMPGVLITEAMAQTSSFSLFPYLEKDIERLSRDFECILVGVDQARFRRPVVPGDTMILTSEVVKCRGKLWAFNCTAEVDGQKVAEAEILANLMLRGETIA